MVSILDALKEERIKDTELSPIELDLKLKRLGCDEETVDDVIFMYKPAEWPEIIKYFEDKYEQLFYKPS